jgi:hypothetical protein
MLGWLKKISKLASIEDCYSIVYLGENKWTVIRITSTSQL